MTNLLRKLTRLHVDQIYRFHALGHEAVAISKLLAVGIVTHDGAELCPVEVSEGTVRHDLNANGGEAAVQEWRLRLYGDVYKSPLAYAGERMRRLESLRDDAAGELASSESMAADPDISATLRASAMEGRSKLRRELAGILRAAGDLMQQVDPNMTITRTADGTRATVSGKVDPATLERIAAKLKAAIGAGVINLDLAEEPAELTGPGPAEGKQPGKDEPVH